MDTAALLSPGSFARSLSARAQPLGQNPAQKKCWRFVTTDPPGPWGDRQAGGRAVAGEPGGQSSQDHLIPPTAAAAPGPGARGEHILSCSPCQGRTV